jgi:hypothetical protein
MALAAVEADAAAGAPGLNPPFSPEQHELALESLLEFCRCVPDGRQRHTWDPNLQRTPHAWHTFQHAATRRAHRATRGRRTACTVSERAACAVPRATTASVSAAALPSCESHAARRSGRAALCWAVVAVWRMRSLDGTLPWCM